MSSSSCLRRLGLVLAGSMLLGACGPVVDLGATDPLGFVDQPRTSRILAPDGTVLADLHGGEDRDEIALDEVADDLVAAVVAVEDRRFFVHGGVDVASIGRAAVRNVEAGEVDQGGSTLTQQLVKTTMTGPARTVERKVEEAVLAVRLERSHDKAAILERYLNTVYFGRGAYGVSAAARRFFALEAEQLSLSQAALLAGVIASPTGFDPWDDPEAALERRAVVLDAMVATGRIDRSTADRAHDEPLELASPTPADDAIAPWVAAEVRRQLQRDPEGRYAAALGDDVEDRVDALFSGGLRVVTTVDLGAQRAAERSVADRLPADGPTAAVVTIDPSTGAIRALVGGHPQDAGVGFNLATQGRRSPGSAFKPLVLATALERGVDLDRTFPGGSCAVLPDVAGWDDDGACNYGQTSYGPLTLREATVRSANTVYARLAAELGPEALRLGARQLGITGELAEVHALALGSEAVVPIDLAAAYGTFATLGTLAEPHLIQRIEGPDGEVLYDHEPRRLRVLDEQVAWLVTDTLTDVVSRGTGIRADIGRPQAGKTGTSQDNADAWFVGYTPDLVTAVWIGYPEGSVPMRPPRLEEVVEGGRWPAEIWADVTDAALQDVSATDFPEPALDLVEVEIDGTRNCLPNPYTPADVIETRSFLQGTQPTDRCTEPTGPQLEDVPPVEGLPAEVANRLLEDRGYEVEVRREHSRVFPPGVITRQRPAPGQDLTVGELVVVWSSVSSRGDLVDPPDVLGSDLDLALTTLEEAGFVVEVRRGCPCSQPPGTVHEQRPAAGVPTPRHGIVTITAVPDVEVGEGGPAVPDAGVAEDGAVPDVGVSEDAPAGPGPTDPSPRAAGR